MTDMQEKIKKLPLWARERIKELEIYSRPITEELRRAHNETEKAKKRAQLLSESNEALLEILRYAGRGGSDWAAQVVSVLEGYEIYRENKEWTVEEILQREG